MITYRVLPLLLVALFPALLQGAETRYLPRVGCESSARALWQSARSEADAAFWRRLGERQADPIHSLRETLRSAAVDRAGALSLADRQHTARLEVCALFGGAPYMPTIVPSEFSSTVDHPYFPLVPGRTLVYESDSDEGVEHVEVTTTEKTVTILGVPCRPVETVKFFDDELEERSTNWYAQHADGSVWWFGELTQHYEDGFLANMNGSWRAGVDGAEPGIFVPADLAVGAPFRRALAIGCAEDVASVVDQNARVSVPFGDFANSLVIEERDPLEPLELILEILVHHIGLVAEVDTNSGERLELVAIQDRGVAERK